MSVLDTDVLESTGNILEVVVTLEDSITTGSTMTNTILDTSERCGDTLQLYSQTQPLQSSAQHPVSELKLTQNSSRRIDSSSEYAGWYEAFQHPQEQVPLPNRQPRQALEPSWQRGISRTT